MKLFVFPGAMSQSVAEAGVGDMAYARTAAFGEVVQECRSSTLRLLGASEHHLIPLSCTGTGAMQALVQNLCAATDRILVIVSGCFGERWHQIAQSHSSEVDCFQVPFGDVLDFEALEQVLQSKQYQWVLTQHHETSSGSLHDIRRIGQLAKAQGTRVAVDAISSFLADDLDCQQMGVDALVLSSHKGLCLPVGLAMVVFRKHLPLQDLGGGSYWHFGQHLESLERGQPLYSPPVPLYQQWLVRLRSLVGEGGASERDRVATKAQAFREALLAQDYALLPKEPSSALTAFFVRRPAAEIASALADEGWFVMPSRLTCQLRVAHLGESTVKDHYQLLERVKRLEMS